MAKTAPEISPASAPDEPLEFDQPLSERMRTFLRIEFLYKQALFHAGDLTGFSARAAVASLLEITAILGRGDVRSEVMKELERHSLLLSGYFKQDDVDIERVESLLSKIEGLRAKISESGPQFMNSLKECEFLNIIKHRSSIPGGTCMFDLPDYAFWLRLPTDVRIAQFNAWTESIKPVCDAVAEALWLTRKGNEPVEQVATGGMYQHQIDRNEQLTLVRVIVSPDAGVFPEISAGKHRFTVRFVTWEDIDIRPSQVVDDVPFLLALC